MVLTGVTTFGGEQIKRFEVEVRVGKLKNGKTAGKNEIMGEILHGGELDLEAVQYGL